MDRIKEEDEPQIAQIVQILGEEHLGDIKSVGVCGICG
jgi:hypothetical protein